MEGNMKNVNKIKQKRKKLKILELTQVLETVDMLLLKRMEIV